VLDAIRLTKKDLRVPLIGFAAAPFTLASYAIEGGGSKTYHATKRMMASDPALFHALMTKIAGATTAYLNAQIGAGADAVQLFDSWVGVLGVDDYERHVMPHVASIFAGLDRSVPAIHFGNGNPALVPLVAKAGGDVIGIDWRAPIAKVWDELGEGVGIQGNLDPAYLLASPEAMKAKATSILEQVGRRPGHIFNLGHGIMPEADPAQVKALVEHVHETSARIRA
jgi:uroporphyrinogen decarboxylase